MTIAGILRKNGYTVSQIKISKEGSKAKEYRLRVEESEENAIIKK